MTRVCRWSSRHRAVTERLGGGGKLSERQIEPLQTEKESTGATAWLISRALSFYDDK